MFLIVFIIFYKPSVKENMFTGGCCSTVRIQYDNEEYLL